VERPARTPGENGQGPPAHDQNRGSRSTTGAATPEGVLQFGEGSGPTLRHPARTHAVVATEQTSASTPAPRVRAADRNQYAARVIPWLVFALIVVPLVVIAFVATRRRNAAGEHPASEDARARALTEQEFAEAEAYDAEWREKDVERHSQERWP